MQMGKTIVTIKVPFVPPVYIFLYASFHLMCVVYTFTYNAYNVSSFCYAVVFMLAVQ